MGLSVSTTASIHMLDDDTLLNVFYFYRPFSLGEHDDNDDTTLLYGGKGPWSRARWWYKPAHVCRRWRNIILGSASYLGVSLVCANRTPAADMLAHSPPLPLVVEYFRDEDNNLTAEDEEGAILALKQYDRLRRVRLWMTRTNLQKLIVAMDDEYPILEYLVIWHPIEDKTTILTFPETLQAPHLRHLLLFGFALPTGSRLMTTPMGLVTLCLAMDHPSTYFHPNTLLQWLSFMPQLENLSISFKFPDNRDMERKLTHMPIMTPVTLPNLLLFMFEGARAYLEALVYRITAPRLEKLHVSLFSHLTFSLPRLLQFANTSENLRFETAKFEFFNKGVKVEVYPYEGAKMYALLIQVKFWHLDWQASSAAQISNSLSPLLSAVKHLTLEHEVHDRSSEEHNEAERTEWRKLLGTFRNVKTLRIGKGLVEELSRCLELDDGELPLELLPELQELTYSGSGDTGDRFSSFINARQDAGHPLTLIRRSTSPDF